MAYNPQALGVEEIREAHASTWREAWRGLRDNPLANYWLLGERRRFRRASLLRRSPALVVGFIAGSLTLLLISFITYDATATGSTPEYGWFWAVPYAALLAAYFIAFVDGISGAVRSGAELLRRARKQTESEPLDDMLIITPLSDHEIAIAALRVILPKLWWPVLGGALILWLHVFLAAAEFDPTSASIISLDSVEAQLTLLTAPLTIGLMLVAGLLGGAITVLFALIMGREAGTAVVAGTAGAVYLIAQFIWLPIAAAASLAMVQGLAYSNTALDPAEGAWVITAALLLPLLPVGLLLFATYLGRLALWLRVSLLLGGPLLLPLIMQFGVGIAVVLLGSSLEYLFNNEAFPVAAVFYARVWGLCLPVNPAILPPDLISAGTWETHLGTIRLAWWLHPFALIAAQLLALRLLGAEALRAIRARRQSAVAS